MSSIKAKLNAHLVGSRAGKKLFPKDWLEIVNLAEQGTPVRKIAEIYSVDISVVYRGLQKRRVNLGAAAQRAAMAEAEKHRAELVKKISDTKDFDYAATQFLQKQVLNRVMEAQKKGERVGGAMDDIKALKIALDAIRTGTDNKWRLLGLDRENQDADAALPELPIRELTEDETSAMRERQRLEDGVLDPDELTLLDDEEQPEDADAEDDGADVTEADETA